MLNQSKLSLISLVALPISVTFTSSAVAAKLTETAFALSRQDCCIFKVRVLSETNVEELKAGSYQHTELRKGHAKGNIKYS